MDGNLNREGIYQGVVLEEDQIGEVTKLRLQIKRVIVDEDTIPYFLDAEHYTYQQDYFLGKTVTIKGRISLKEKPHKRIILKGSIINQDYSLSFVGRLFNEVYAHIIRTIHRGLDQENIPVAQGLILGGSHRLSPKEKDIFVRAGVLHILAVSGLHIGFVIAFLGMLLLPFPITPRIKFVVIMACLLIYAGITGFRPNVLRASLMAFLLGISLLLQRQVDTMHVVNMSALILLLLNPLILFDPSAQLSFAAVYGIVYLLPYFNEHLLKGIKSSMLKLVLGAMATSFSAQLFVAPFLIHYFQRLPTLAILSNVLIVPLASVVVYLLFMMIIASLISKSAISIFAFFANQAIFLLKELARFFAQVPFSSIGLSIPPLFLLLFFFIFVRKTRKWALFGLGIVAIIFSIFPDHSIKMTANNALITLPGGETILICKSKKDWAANLKITEVDYLIADQRTMNCRKEFIPLPPAYHIKEIQIAEHRIKIDGGISIFWHDREFKLPDEILGDSMVIVTLGKKGIYSFVSSFDSIFDEFLITLKTLWGQIQVNI
ncbi:MAG: ComEC/Rec2 family competence protein [candidate division WOR-3 bacterium]